MRAPTLQPRLLLGIALCAAILNSFPSASAAFKHISDGMTIPEVKGSALVGGETISSGPTGIEGEVTVVVFWATWSRRSLELLNDLEAMLREHPDHPLRVIAINVEGEMAEEGLRERILQLAEEGGFSFPVLMDDRLEIFYEFGVIAVPSTAIVDDRGVLLHGPAGYSALAKDGIRDAIEHGLGLLVEESSERRAVYRPDKDAGRRFGLALRLTHQGRPERALKQVDQAIEADPGFAAPQILRGELLLELGRVDDALLAYQRAHELDDSSAVALAGWGRALMAASDFASATEKLLAALALEESFTPALLDLSRCHIRASRFDEALAALEEALELNPSDPHVYEAIGHAHRGSGQIAKAIEAYRAALQLRYPRP